MIALAKLAYQFIKIQIQAHRQGEGNIPTENDGDTNEKQMGIILKCLNFLNTPVFEPCWKDLFTGSRMWMVMEKWGWGGHSFFPEKHLMPVGWMVWAQKRSPDWGPKWKDGKRSRGKQWVWWNCLDREWLLERIRRQAGTDWWGNVILPTALLKYNWYKMNYMFWKVCNWSFWQRYTQRSINTVKRMHNSITFRYLLFCFNPLTPPLPTIFVPSQNRSAFVF